MYKVFLNDKVMVFASGNENIYRNNDHVVFDLVNTQELDVLADTFIHQDQVKEMMISSDDPESMFKGFCNRFPVVEAAGGLVLCNNSLLMIYRKGKWDLPKGKVDPGEGWVETAVREIGEETGVRNIQYEHDIVNTWHMLLKDDRWFIKLTHWFLFSSESETTLSPALEEDITDARWIRLHQLPLLMGNLYESLFDVLVMALCSDKPQKKK